MPKKKAYAFNPTQIKDGRIVRLRKDGTIKVDLGPYIVKRPRRIEIANKPDSSTGTV